MCITSERSHHRQLWGLLLSRSARKKKKPKKKQFKNDIPLAPVARGIGIRSRFFTTLASGGGRCELLLMSARENVWWLGGFALPRGVAVPPFRREDSICKLGTQNDLSLTVRLRIDLFYNIFDKC